MIISVLERETPGPIVIMKTISIMALMIMLQE